MTPSHPLPRAALAASLALALGLSACGARDDERSAGQKVDAAIAKADEKADAAKAELERDAQRAQQAAAQAMADSKQAAGDATRAVGEAVTDTAITAEVKARLAADADLKLLDVKVETDAGRTVLTGKAPTADARDRASRIAAEVKGVSAVDNKLAVAP